MEGGGSEVERLCVGDEGGAVGTDDGALFKWVGTFFGWACCSGGLKRGAGVACPTGGWKMGAGGWRRVLGKDEGKGAEEGFQLLWLAVCTAL